MSLKPPEARQPSQPAAAAHRRISTRRKQYRASEEGILKGRCPLSRRRHASPKAVPHPTARNRRAFRRPKKSWEQQRLLSQPRRMGRPHNGRRNRQTVRHRRGDAVNDCPPKAAGGRQKHTHTAHASANGYTQSPHTPQPPPVEPPQKSRQQSQPKRVHPFAAFILHIAPFNSLRFHFVQTPSPTAAAPRFGCKSATGRFA